MKVRDRLAEFDYVLKDEQEADEAEQTHWTLRGLPFDMDVALRRRAAKSKLEIPGAGKAMGKGQEAWTKAMESSSMILDMEGGQIALEFDILKYGLMAVSNLIGPDGNEIEYPGSKASDSSKKNWFSQWLDPKFRTELANAITEHSALSEDDVKN